MMELRDKRFIYLYENIYNEKVNIVNGKIECTVQCFSKYLNLWIYIDKTEIKLK